MHKNENPWLTIPGADYESHMTFVGQLQMIREELKLFLQNNEVPDLIYLGAGVGTGLENIDNPALPVTAIDINFNYLVTLNSRYRHLKNLKLINLDIDDVILPDRKHGFIYAPLFFEYVPLHSTLKKCYEWLAKCGQLLTILQHVSDDVQSVSPSPYTSLQRLAPVIQHHMPETFCEEAQVAGFDIREMHVVSVEKKQFAIINLIKPSHTQR